MASFADGLPSSSSPDLDLTTQTDEEKLQIWRLNGKIWSGPQSLDQYVGRECYISHHGIAANGGMTCWVLTDITKSPKDRPILASCESLRKRAFIKLPHKEPEETVIYGIASVFCNPVLQGRGYARRMMDLLSAKLVKWNQTEGVETPFSILYSDIGKQFYARGGWTPFRSDEINLKPVRSSSLTTSQLMSDNLEDLCEKDVGMLKKAMKDSNSERVIVAILPDYQSMVWHHARENYIAEALFGLQPTAKGACSEFSSGKLAWCVWSRFFGDIPSNNTLAILRIVLEDEDHSVVSSHSVPNQQSAGPSERICAIASLLRAAQHEAAQWAMSVVQIWNPTAEVLSAARQIEENCEVVTREHESIASLKWHTEDGISQPTEWFANEKFAWC